MPKQPIWNSLEVLARNILFKDGETEPFVTRREKVVKSKSRSVDILFFLSFPYQVPFFFSPPFLPFIFFYHLNIYAIYAHLTTRGHFSKHSSTARW